MNHQNTENIKKRKNSQCCLERNSEHTCFSGRLDLQTEKDAERFMRRSCRTSRLRTLTADYRASVWGLEARASERNEEAGLTLNEEEEADDAHDRDDESRHDEGQTPVRGDPVAGDQGAQDVSHRGVGVPQPHDESTPDRK